MAIINWPTNIKVGSADYGVEFTGLVLNLYRNGKLTTFNLPGSARWVCSLRFEGELETMQRPRIEALITRLRGGENRLSMPHWGRPVPN